MVGLSVSDIVGGVDDEVSRVDVVAFQGGLQKFGVVDGAVLFEVEQLVLHKETLTFVFTPKNLNSSTSTVRSYLNWPSFVRNSALSRSSNLYLSSVNGLTK